MKTLITIILSAASASAAWAGAPVCTEPRHCERMWAAAHDALTLATGMRIRLVSESRIETYPANDYGRLGGVVTKTPIGTGSYEISLSLECYRGTNCDKARAANIDLFNTLVGSTPTPPSKPAAPTEPTPLAGPSLIADELAKLAALRKQGVLSQTEFDQQKRRLLGGGHDAAPPPKP